MCFIFLECMKPEGLVNVGSFRCSVFFFVLDVDVLFLILWGGGRVVLGIVRRYSAWKAGFNLVNRRRPLINGKHKAVCKAGHF